MNRREHGSVSALARWRAFGEARASDRFRRESFETRQAAARADEAGTRLNDVSQSRSALLRADDIDLPRLQVSAQIEHATAEHLRARQDELAAAQQRRDDAQSTYVAARADTRVADARGERLATAERDRREKTLFDQMADLHTQSRSASR